ncbi:MAG: hypothetical protein RI907_1968 [Pseudomonadota bacterium]|jgi:hypothetical protein
MKHRRPRLIGPLVFLACGLSGTLHAQESLDAPAPDQARLILDSNGPARVYWSAQPDCSEQSQPLVRLHPTEGERLRGSAKNVRPAPSAWLRFRTQRPDGLANCDLGGSLKVEGGRNYIAMFRADGEANECMLQVMQQMPDGSIELAPGFQAFQVCTAAGAAQGLKSKPVPR